MQYILTKQEFDSLISVKQYEEICHQIQDLNKLVLKLSNYRCYKDSGGYGVCDACPLVKIGSCPKPKRYSK